MVKEGSGNGVSRSVWEIWEGNLEEGFLYWELKDM
jgi:hypothetical protein